MRHDLFQSKKSLHIKMDKTVHAGFRTKLFQHNLSMQEVFEEFARLYIAEDHRLNKIVSQLCERKLRDYLAGITPRKKRTKDLDVSELDQDTLYDLIISAAENKKDDGKED